MFLTFCRFSCILSLLQQKGTGQMINELIKDMELAKEMKLTVTVIHVNSDMRVSEGVISLVKTILSGHKFVIGDKEFLVNCDDMIDCVEVGNKKYYNLRTVDNTNYNLTIIF